MAEKTLVMPVDYLPEDRDWVWMPDVNIVLVRDTLDSLGLQRALIEVGIEWRRSCLTLVKAS